MRISGSSPYACPKVPEQWQRNEAEKQRSWKNSGNEKDATLKEDVWKLDYKWVFFNAFLMHIFKELLKINSL